MYVVKVVPQCARYIAIWAPSPDMPALDTLLYFYNNRIMERGQAKVLPVADRTATYADMFAAIGSEPRLRILRLLLAAHPDGMVVGEIAEELDTTASTLSHHLEKLKNEDLVRVQREGTFLRYSANTVGLEQLLAFLYAECCTRNKAVEPQKIVCCK